MIPMRLFLPLPYYTIKLSARRKITLLHSFSSYLIHFRSMITGNAGIIQLRELIEGWSVTIHFSSSIDHEKIHRFLSHNMMMIIVLRSNCSWIVILLGTFSTLKLACRLFLCHLSTHNWLWHSQQLFHYLCITPLFSWSCIVTSMTLIFTLSPLLFLLISTISIYISISLNEDQIIVESV